MYDVGCTMYDVRTKNEVQNINNKYELSKLFLSEFR